MELLTVRYIGPDAAILAGTYILSGETRPVMPAQVAEAEINHPGAFEVVDGTWPAMPIQLDEPALEQVPSEPEPTNLDEPATPEPTNLDEPAPAAREAQRPAAVRRGRR